MNYYAGECKLNKMDFQVLPRALRVYQPDNCGDGQQPGIDFSWGFPDPWHLTFTDISVPSQHMMDGKLYDAEVILSHVYSVDQDDRLVSTNEKETSATKTINQPNLYVLPKT
jgi:hypothetical protein